MSRRKPIFVIAYDFDGTLAPGNMQEHKFLPSLEIDPPVFWEKVKEHAKDQIGDEILVYMYDMLQVSKAKQQPIRRADFNELGEKIPFFPGIEEGWFKRINEYGKSKGLEVKHFIISSGLREIIEGTIIYDEFEKVYASGFMYDENKVACWPALAINYTTKTQFLFRINKWTLDEYDDREINAFVPDNEREVPFKNMVFIGDGATDIPSMKLVKKMGGHSIAVYPAKTKDAKKKVANLIKGGDRADMIAKADYRENEDIDKAIKAIIDAVSSGYVIENLAIKNQPKTKTVTKNVGDKKGSPLIPESKKL